MLPNAEHAIIDRTKLQDYLLSFGHPVGRFKARFFAGAWASRPSIGTCSSRHFVASI